MTQVHLAFEVGPIGGPHNTLETVVLNAHDDGQITVWPEWMPITKAGTPIGSIDGSWDAEAVEDALRRIGADVIREAIAAGDTSLVGLAVTVDLIDHGARRYLPIEIRGLESRAEGPLHEYWGGPGYEVQIELSIEGGRVVVTVLHPDPGAWYRPEPGNVMRWCPGNIDRADFAEWLSSPGGITWANRAIWGADDPAGDGTFDELAAQGWSYLPTRDFADLDEAPDDPPMLRVWSLIVQDIALDSRVLLSDDPAAAAYEYRDQHPA